MEREDFEKYRKWLRIEADGEFTDLNWTAGEHTVARINALRDMAKAYGEPEFTLKGRTGRTYYAFRKPSHFQRLTTWFTHLFKTKR